MDQEEVERLVAACKRSLLPRRDKAIILFLLQDGYPMDRDSLRRIFNRRSGQAGVHASPTGCGIAPPSRTYGRGWTC